MIINIDGACKGNPGPGGWAVVLDDGSHFSGHQTDTTNNQMELQALIEALNLLAADSRATIRTDSQNVVGWMSKQWKRKVTHIAELCAEADRLIAEKRLHIEFEWVKGHNGDALNERANRLADDASKSAC